MSFLVGLQCNGFAAVFDVHSRITKVYDVREDANLGNFDAVLQKLCECVKPTEVQRLVVSQFLPYSPNLQSARQKLVALGFKNVHFAYWMNTHVQAIVNEKFIRTVVSENVLVTVGERTTLWHFTNNTMKFISSLESLFVVKHTTVSGVTADPNFVTDAQKVIQTYEVRRWFVLNSPDTRNLIRSNNLVVHVVQWDHQITPQQLALVTLWTAQRREGVVEGVLVENYYWRGPRVEVDNIVIHDEVSKGVAVPFEMVSNYVTVTKNITVYHNIAQWKFNFQTEEIVKIQLCFDEDGVLDVTLTQPQTASILLRNEQMYLVVSATNDVPDPPMIGPFPTRLRFEKESVTVNKNDSGENILSGVLQMLDPSNPAEPGWQLVNNRFTAKIRLPDGTNKNVDAQTAASHLLLFAINKVSRPDEWLEKLSVVVPETFTKNQCKNLIAAASMIGISAIIKRELDAVADGYAKKQNLQDEDRVIVMHPTVSGCKLKLFKVSDQKTELEAAKFDAKMNCEVLRQNQRNWEKRVHDSVNPIESGASEEEIFQLEHSSHSVDEESELWLEALRSTLRTLVPDGKRDTVKRIVFVGADARRLPLLNNILFWTFLKAKVHTVVEEELKQLAVVTPRHRYLPTAQR